MSNTKRNQWGTETFADLISMAIQSAPQQKITLQGIYQFLINEKAYFRQRQDKKIAAGWQNSVRHNLSLHKQFVLDGSTRPGLWSLDQSRLEQPAKRGRPRKTSASTPSPQNCSPNSSDASRVSYVEEIAYVPNGGYLPNVNFEPCEYSVRVGNSNAGYYHGPQIDFYASFDESPAQETHAVSFTDFTNIDPQEELRKYFNWS